MTAAKAGRDGSQKGHHGYKDAHSHIRKLAVIGTGKIGEALLSSMLGAQLISVSHVVATDADPPRADYISEKYGIKTSTKNLQAVAGADLVMLCVKPQQVADVLRDVRKGLAKNSLIISVAASVTTALIERELDHGHRVVRVMPNTPCLIRQGMSAIARGKHATADDVKVAQMIFSAMGRTVVVDEKHMDAITGLSASGPAYVYLIIESLAEGGVKLGLPRELSTELSAQTLLGASAMVLHTGEHPAKLKERGHDSRRLHHRRADRTRGGRPARHLNQGRRACGRARSPACAEPEYLAPGKLQKHRLFAGAVGISFRAKEWYHALGWRRSHERRNLLARRRPRPDCFRLSSPESSPPFPLLHQISRQEARHLP